MRDKEDIIAVIFVGIVTFTIVLFLLAAIL